MAGWLDGIEEGAFKPTTGGYVFRAPSPWLFGKPSYYLVDAAQKATIGALLRKRVQLAMTFALIMLLIALTLSFILLRSDQFLHAPRYLAGVTFGVLVALMVVVVPQVYLMKRLRPIIEGLPPTDQRFARGEHLRRVAAAMPSWLIYSGLAVGILMVFLGLLDMVEPMSAGRSAHRWMPQVLRLIVGLVVVGNFGCLAYLKKRAEAS